MKILISFLLIFTGLRSGEGLVNHPDKDPVEGLDTHGGSRLISEWITVHLKTIRTGKVFNHHVRQSAYIGLALYESIVPGDNNYRSLSDQLSGYKPKHTGTLSKDICWQASANTAFSTMLKFFYPQDPASVARFDSLKNVLNRRLLEEGYSAASISAGSEYGAQVSQAVIEWSKSDNDDKANAAFTVPVGTGLWEPTPPGFVRPITPFMGNNRTFVEASIDNTLPPPPLTFSEEKESEFYKMVSEVYTISLQMNQDMKAIGLFWDDFPDGQTVTGGGHWASILKTVLNDRNISLIEGAHLYAALFICANDAAIGCFKAKYTYNLLRPVTYIRKYMKHPEWNPMIATPPHPEYPAAHAVVSMAAATILTRIMGENISFTDDTYSYRGYGKRYFNNFREAAREAGISRFYGGIHYLPSIEAGYVQGEKIANNVADKLIFKNSK
jgi:hypothetical protein